MQYLIENFNKISMIVNDLLKNILNEDGNVPKPGKTPKFSDLNVISLSLTSEALKIDSENNLFEILHNNYASFFPNLIHRTQYNRRRKKLFPYLNLVREKIIYEIEADNSSNIVDSMPLPICKFVRANRLKICKEEPETSPEFAFNAAQNMHYYGYKFHAVCSRTGVIKHFDISKANHHDINYLQDIRDVFPNSELLGDLGYLSGDLQMELFDVHRIRLITPMRSNQINYIPQKPELKNARKRIETIFSQLIDFLNVRINYAKSFLGLASRILAKVTTFSLLQLINKNNGRNINFVKQALCY